MDAAPSSDMLAQLREARRKLAEKHMSQAEPEAAPAATTTTALGADAENAGSGGIIRGDGANGGSSSTSMAASPPPAPLQLCSFNIWFSDVHQQQRMEAVARILDGGDDGKSRPLVIGLQELTAPLWGMLEPRLRASGFNSFVKQPFDVYGVLLATRPPMGPPQRARFVPYRNTRMDRGLALGVVAWPGVGKLAVGTTHLESFIGEGEDALVKQARKQQLVEATGLLQTEARESGCVGAVFMGDFNWQDDKDGDTTSAIGSNSWVDASDATGRQRGTLGTCGSWRLDRLLYWGNPADTAGRTLAGGDSRGASGHAALRATALQLAGKQPIPGLTYQKYNNSTRQETTRKCYPSDHRALFVTLECGGTKANATTLANAAAVSSAAASSNAAAQSTHRPLPTREEEAPTWQAAAARLVGSRVVAVRRGLPLGGLPEDTLLQVGASEGDVLFAGGGPAAAAGGGSSLEPGGGLRVRGAESFAALAGKAIERVESREWRKSGPGPSKGKRAADKEAGGGGKRTGPVLFFEGNVSVFAARDASGSEPANLSFVEGGARGGCLVVGHPAD